MHDYIPNIQIKVNNYLFIKDPESSALGKRIIAGSIDLLYQQGFEDFNFKKLAEQIHSTEASIYRYFENKHKILLYLTMWYWGWTESKLILSTTNINDPEELLKRAIKVITQDVQEDGNFEHINEIKLQKVIYDESAKAYLNKYVDDENKHGVFSFYKSVVKRVSDIMLAINPEYPFPNMLVTTIIEGAHLQRYFGEHLPGLTNCSSKRDHITQFSEHLVFSALNNN